MIDFHCHLDLFPEPESIISEVHKAQIYALAVTTTPKAWEKLSSLLRGKNRIRAAIGIHPELVPERASEVDEVVKIMSDVRYVGEIGLDGSPHLKGSLELQQDVFTTVLDQASQLGGRILSIHSRNASGPTLDILERYPNAGTPILHWFSGTKRELDRAVSLGCWFSVGPAMLRGNKGAALAAAMPRDRLLTETDSPFAQVRGRSLSPLDVGQAVEALASIWELPLAEVTSRLTQNFRSLVS